MPDTPRTSHRLFLLAAFFGIGIRFCIHVPSAHGDLVIPDANSGYQFDGNLHDSGSNGWNAIGSATYTTGKFSDAVSISPTSGAVDLGNHFNDFGRNNPHSFSFWYETSKDDNDLQMLLSSRDASNGYNGVVCVLNGNAISHDGGIECNVIEHDNPNNQFVTWTSAGHSVTKNG